MKLPNQDAMKGAIQALDDAFIASVQKTYESNGINEAYSALSSADAARTAYLQDDLSLQEIKNEIAKDVGDPVDHAKLPETKTS